MAKKYRLYNIWRTMHQRCYDERAHSYCRYGAKGIGICPEWKDNFPTFREWALENGYEETLTIDRRDNSVGYQPSNCRWVTMSNQAWNRSRPRNAKERYRGVSFHKTSGLWKVAVRGKHVGYFKDEAQAARAHDVAAKAAYGEFAMLNFPSDPTDEG